MLRGSRQCPWHFKRRQDKTKSPICVLHGLALNAVKGGGKGGKGEGCTTKDEGKH